VPVDEADGIIAGHGRVLAAHKLAIAEVPVMVAAGWSEAQKRPLPFGDQKISTRSSAGAFGISHYVGAIRNAADFFEGGYEPEND
jgi:hypothetical protein